LKLTLNGLTKNHTNLNITFISSNFDLIKYKSRNIHLLKPKQMATQKLKELTNEQLTKKDKDVTTLLIVTLIFYSIAIIILLVFKPLMALIIFPLLVTVLPLAVGRKKIKEEIKKRMNIN